MKRNEFNKLAIERAKLDKIYNENSYRTWQINKNSTFELNCATGQFGLMFYDDIDYRNVFLPAGTTFYKSNISQFNDAEQKRISFLEQKVKMWLANELDILPE